MTDFNKIDFYLKRIKILNENGLNEFKEYILNLNLSIEEKKQLLTKLFNYDIEKNKLSLFNEIVNKYDLNQYISSILEYKIYDDIIHKYLYYKIKQDDKYQDILNNPVNNCNLKLTKSLIKEQSNKSNNIIKDLNDKLKKELNYIDNFISNTNFLKRISNECYIYVIDSEDNQIIPFNKLIIENNQKFQYKFSIKKYYHNDILQSYQYYFKAAINFFLNNSEFISQIIDNQNHELSDLSDTVNSLKFNGGNYIEFYDLIKEMYNENNQNNNIDNYYIKLKGYINGQLDNKYCLGIPGFKIYPYYVIQDILIMLKDQFSNNCIIEYKNGYKSFILNCEQNCFIEDLFFIHDYNMYYSIDDLKLDKLKQIIKDCEGIDEYEDSHTLCDSEINKINFIIKNNKYYIENNICDYIFKSNILNYPKNLLIACPIHNITGLYMFNNKISFYKYSYNNELEDKKFENNQEKNKEFNERISTIISKIKEWYEVSIIYPFIINIDNNKYYLHSFINLVNNETITSHFAYYKVDYKDIDLNDDNIDYSNIDLLKYDGNKFRINQHNLKHYPIFIKNEFNILRHNDYNSDYIKDNLSCKIVFCYYRKL